MGRIPSEDIPQADALPDVLTTVEAVGSGLRTFQDMAGAIGKVERQGRYYRRAAEILGLIEPEGPNSSKLTAKGREYMMADAKQRAKIVASSVLGSTLIQRIIPLVESSRNSGISRDELRDFIQAVTERTGPTMVPRRTSTVIAWLECIGMLLRKDDRFYLGNMPEGISLLDYSHSDEPLLPPKFDLAEYISVSKIVSSAKEEITFSVDAAQRERAERSHQVITDLVAARLRARGAIPRRNLFVDLAANVDAKPFIFEIKSTTTANAHAQIRRGVSQLYEYRYVQRVPEARLVLVLENPVPEKLGWMMDYLILDRKILVAWDGDRRHLHCDDRQRRDLAFLL